MTDPTPNADDRASWAAPSGGIAPDAPPAGGGATTGPAGQDWRHAQAGRGEQGWRPAPKPGLVPLRPMTLGTLLAAPFTVLRRNPRATFGNAIVVQAVPAVLTVVAVALVTGLAIGRVNAASLDDVQAITSGAVAGGIIAVLIPTLLSVVSLALVQALISAEVGSAVIGERLTFAGLWRRSRGRLLAVVGWIGLLALGSVVGVGVAAGLVALAAVSGGPLLAVPLGLLAGAIAIAVGLWLGVKLAFVPSALVLERLPLRDAVARSWTLVRGSFWRVLGVIVLVWLIVSVATQVISTPIALIAGIGGAILDPTGDVLAGPTGIVVNVVSIVVGLVLGAITAVVQAAVASLLYIDLRFRREGLDVRLQRIVEDRAAGREDAADTIR